MLSYGDYSGESHGYTLLLTYQAARTPPSHAPCKVGEWEPVPNSPIYGQVRVALPAEAIKLIERDPATRRLTLLIAGASLHDVTQRLGEQGGGGQPATRSEAK